MHEKLYKDLDSILRKMSNGKILQGLECIEEVGYEFGSTLLDQLENEGYIVRRAPNHRQITPNGLKFINEGGYAEFHKRQRESAYITKSSYAWTKAGVWLATIFALLSLLYQIISDRIVI